MKEHLLQNKNTFEKMYTASEGGINYPESHLIRLYEHYIKNIIAKDKAALRVFDFGCGTGTNCLFYLGKGFEAYGVDISENAIEQCHQNPSLSKENFKAISPLEDITEIFDVKFDLIVSNLVLMYLSNSEIITTLKQFDNMLEKDGIVLFTMPSEKHYYFLYSKEGTDGLRKVSLSGRYDFVEYANFCRDEDDMIDKFRVFNKIFTGYFDYKAPEGSTLSYFFIGNKM